MIPLLTGIIGIGGAVLGGVIFSQIDGYSTWIGILGGGALGAIVGAIIGAIYGG